MSLIYSKEKYEAHEVFLSTPKPRSMSITKFRFTICEIDNSKMIPSKIDKISDEDYLKALKLHNNPRSKSVQKLKIEEAENEYSNDFEPEDSPKYSLVTLKLMKKQLQKKKKMIEIKKNQKAEMMKQKENEEKNALDEEAKENFLKWNEEKKKQINERKKLKALAEIKKSQQKELKVQMKIEKKFREMEERQLRLSKLKHEDLINRKNQPKNQDFPTILAYSTSRKIKQGM